MAEVENQSTVLQEIENGLFKSVEELVVEAFKEAAKTTMADRLAALEEELKSTEAASLARIKAAQDKLDTDLARLDERKQAVESVADECTGEIVHLNVGGTVFSASKDVFMASTDSFFYNLLGSKTWAKNDAGQYFIDRDPSLFPHIMTFLRSGSWFTHTLNAEERDRLEAELKFYDIKLPRNWTTLDPSKAYYAISLTNSGTQCTGSGTVLGIDSLPAHAVWDVIIDAKTGNAWTGIGIATSSTDLGSLCCDTSFGAGLYIDQNNTHFREKANNIEQLNDTIGPAVAGKVIRITYNRTQDGMTIRFEVNGRSTRNYPVRLPDRKVYIAMSPTSDCVMTMRMVEEGDEPVIDGTGEW